MERISEKEEYGGIFYATGYYYWRCNHCGAVMDDIDDCDIEQDGAEEVLQ